MQYLEIALAVAAAVLITSLAISPDRVDRIRAWWRESRAELPAAPNRVMPWELEKIQRQATAQAMQAEVDGRFQAKAVLIADGGATFTDGDLTDARPKAQEASATQQKL